MITPMLAAKAYAAVQGAGAGDPAAPGAAPTELSFGDILKGVLKDTVQATKSAESQMITGAQGKANLIDVVTAINSAETSLQTVIAVRDQVISAYQSVMQMQI